ncbi:PREDICTED: N-acetylgalactosaminyltransferase 7 [Polistes dominula]|uniref:Polypeptide N-acetylgalactosaminyltransferase n=1 Tax=Polistes dominula TaxID=743375 RepID=A0ABM1J6P7_POLDO|nr:PREDICTED: N-acetylgalactosaminyltransferase 7 [Polistes dominula]XP_015188135.1 PREDICTED: N-acetylgalactosaminyltransferase 7 [Polistes dominula]XP_015188144.1 PREDICTED: N-acetylgalactosaminyltransferase 7 [Polistes dominula]
MRIVQLRRHRLFNIIIGGLLVLIIFYTIVSFFSDNQVHNIKVYWSEQLATKQVPELVEDLGNYEPRNVQPRVGPGEDGKAHILRDDQQNDVQQSESDYGMNMVCSDEISLDRSIPDTRPPECKHWNYPLVLPKTSVIIVFHNEGWSVLMRTVHSVMNRTPSKLLEEILLVDDYSDKENLKGDLESYIEQWKGKVRLIRNTERQGLIRTRSRGAREATGEVIVFLDAHCEVNVNWLPPLLAPIALNSNVMTVPVIDGIDHKNFAYRPVYQAGHLYRGIFEWGMLYKENELPKREAKTRPHDSMPYKSPTHAGGLFAINRKYFLSLGGYDEGLLVWGGENFELSFKIWQCGGSILWVPCSHVGHVYRGFMPYTFGKLAQKKKGPLITINYKRVIETWFDEKHKEFFYTREPLARLLNHGDITEQLLFKERKKCKSFQWYMDNVAYDVLDKFPELPPNMHWGELRNGATGACLDTMGHAPPSLMATSYCHNYGNNQLIRLNSKGQLGVGERCIEADSNGVKLAFCRLGTVDGPWQYDEKTKTLLHRVHKKCMALHPQTQQLSLMPCDVNNTYQQWSFHEIDPHW